MDRRWVKTFRSKRLHVCVVLANRKETLLCWLRWKLLVPQCLAAQTQSIHSCDTCACRCMWSSYIHTHLFLKPWLSTISLREPRHGQLVGEEDVLPSQLITAISSLWQSNDMVNTAVLKQTSIHNRRHIFTHTRTDVFNPGANWLTIHIA